MKTVDKILDKCDDDYGSGMSYENIVKAMKLYAEQAVKHHLKKLEKSLGEPVDGNGYLIKPFDGKWWVEHAVIGSGEPLEQFFNTNIELP